MDLFMSENTQVAVTETAQNNAVATQQRPLASRYTAEELEQSDLNNGAMIPDTSSSAPLPIKLNEENLELELGEFMDFVVIGIGMKPFPSMNPDRQGLTEMVKSVSLASLGEDKDGNPKIMRWSLSAKRAVSTIEDAIQRGYVILGNSRTMVRITYTGEIRNKTNAFKSRTFDIEVLLNG
jgi:hypothetical protein